eukprot:UN08431
MFAGQNLLFGVLGTVFVRFCICFVGFFMRRKRKQQEYSKSAKRVHQGIRSVSGIELGTYDRQLNSNSPPNSPDSQVEIGYIEDGPQGTQASYDNAINIIHSYQTNNVNLAMIGYNNDNQIGPTEGAIIKEDSYSEDSTNRVRVTPYGHNAEEKDEIVLDPNYRMAASLAKYDDEVIGDDEEAEFGDVKTPKY